MEIRPTTARSIRRLFDSDDVYKMTSPRGRVLIIHNDEFDHKMNQDQANLDDRVGSECDVEGLEETFKQLDFDVVIGNNLSSKPMLDRIEGETALEHHKTYGMFVLVILSHGDLGVVYGADSRKVSIDDITKRLSAKNFPTMADKPKLIIIQACSGAESDNTFHRMESDNSERFEAPGSVASPIARSTVADFIVVQASYPGFKSFRDPRSGTFLVRSLIKVLRKHACHENIHDIIRRVRQMVIELCENHNEKCQGVQTVYSTETLLKKLYFFPGMTQSDSPDDSGSTNCEETLFNTTYLIHSPSGLKPKSRRNLKMARAPGSLAAAANLSGRSLSKSFPPVVVPVPSLGSLMEVKHIKTIPTPNYCYCAAIHSGKKVLHGGVHYDHIHKSYDLTVVCIRQTHENEVVHLENDETGKSFAVTYKLAFNTAKNRYEYTPTGRVKLKYSESLTHFTITGRFLIHCGGDTDKVYFYKYPTGELITRVTHPEMKHPHGICHDGGSCLYVTDNVTDSIFKIKFKWKDDSAELSKLIYEVKAPTGIALYNNLLGVLSNDWTVMPQLHIITTEGEIVNVIALSECRGNLVPDLSISAQGVIAIANNTKGIQLYEF